MYTLLFSIITAEYRAPWFLYAPPSVEVVSGLARQDNFVPSMPFREDGLEGLTLSNGGGAPNKYSKVLAVAQQTKPVNSDSLQVQVELVVSTP